MSDRDEHAAYLRRREEQARAQADDEQSAGEAARLAGDDDERLRRLDQAARWLREARRYAAELDALELGRVHVYEPDSPESLEAAAAVKAGNVRAAAEQRQPTGALFASYQRTRHRATVAARRHDGVIRTVAARAPRRAASSSGRPAGRRARATARGPDDGPGSDGPGDAGPPPEAAP